MTSLVPENPMSLVKAAAAVRTGETTASELVSQCLERIETSDGDLQAFVSVQASDALARAAELDASAAAGRFAGPLHGIPVAIKDIIDVAGLPTAAGMSVEAVEEAKKRFQEDTPGESPVIVLSIQAAKTGHTLTAAQDILFVEEPWTPADVDQTYSRLHRIGQQGSVTATYMLTAGTVDEEIYDLIEAKRLVVNTATEGGDAAGSSGSPVAGALIESLLNQTSVA